MVDDLIFIAGASGMVGSALQRHLRSKGFKHLLTPSRTELNLLDQHRVREYLCHHHPKIVIVAAAKVGGIWANKNFPAQFLYENMTIASHLIHESHQAGVDRLLYLGSTCIYPREAPQPIRESSLLSGPLEATNEAYALAKICGVKLVEYYAKEFGRKYISAMPTNLYGPQDRYHPDNSHVIPALILRFHEARERKLPQVKVWGTGQVKREFLYVDDLAEAVLFLLENYFDPTTINIGSNDEVTIAELAKEIAVVTGYPGDLVFDPTYPDGTPRKKTDLSKISALGWKAKTPLRIGLKIAYDDFLSRRASFLSIPAFAR